MSERDNQSEPPARRHSLFSTVVREYQWIHIGLGLLGNTCFVLGSFFFLSAALKTTGTWLFIFGSIGMLVGSVGSAIVRYEERREGARRPSRPASSSRSSRRAAEAL